MNIVKIKDVSITAPNNSAAIPEDFALYKDKYCYCINWKWIVLFEDIDALQYVDCSKNDDIGEIRHADMEEYAAADLIDWAETEKANAVTKFVEYNKFSPSDSDLTYDDVKLFRTWLAETLYNILQDEESEDVLEMLNYYKSEMNDDTIKHLTLFAPKSYVDFITATNRSTCGCQGSTGTNVLSGVSVCDPIAIYRKAIYEKMVEVFSDVHFWQSRETALLEEIKKYIDFIIAKNLPLTASQYVSDLYDCGCLSDAASSQQRLMSYLKNLSVALGFLITDEVGKKNFIGDAFNKWAVYLYEKMRWY